MPSAKLRLGTARYRPARSQAVKVLEILVFVGGTCKVHTGEHIRGIVHEWRASSADPYEDQQLLDDLLAVKQNST